MEGIYSKTWIVEQWLRRSMMPRNPEEGGVGSNGQAVMDCNQFQIDHNDPDSSMYNQYYNTVVNTHKFI